MRRQPFTILLHIALVIILTGAFVTHFCGIQGKITLHTDGAPVSHFEKESGPGNGELPFSVALDKVEIDYYPATTTPMDFRSVLSIDGDRITVSGVFHRQVLQFQIHRRKCRLPCRIGLIIFSDFFLS